MRLFILSSVVLFFIWTGCRKKEENSEIPLVAVNFTIYTTDPLNSNLQANGGHVYYSAGSRGIIIYRKSTEEFKAYDRHCPYNVNSSCGIVSVDASGITAVDTCCGSSFTLIDGSVVKGPATSPLKQYRCNVNGNQIVISN